MPARRRSSAGRDQRPSPTFTATPAPYSSAAISTSSSPNSVATLSFSARPGAVAAKASFDSAQAARAAAPAAGTASTASDRSRSGTTASQMIAPTAAAASAPRDCVSRIASRAAPMPG